MTGRKEVTRERIDDELLPADAREGGFRVEADAHGRDGKGREACVGEGSARRAFENRRL